MGDEKHIATIIRLAEERDAAVRALAAAREENEELREALEPFAFCERIDSFPTPATRTRRQEPCGECDGCKARAALAREATEKAAIDSQLRQMLGDEEFERFREAVDGPREATDADR